ncbi:ribonuclease E/G [Rickettsiales bacterium LUAb2]
MNISNTKSLNIYNNNFGSLFFSLNNNQLSDYYFTNNDSILNNIYYGKITEYSNSLNLYFIDLGNNLSAILKANKNNKLTLGQKIIVQVIKDAENNKQPLVTTKLSLNGLYSVYLPNNHTTGETIVTHEKIKFSHNLNSDSTNELSSYIENNINLDHENIIIRSIANIKNIEGLLFELKIKQQLWQDILLKITNNKLGLLLAIPPILNIIYSNNLNIPKHITCNSIEMLNQIQDDIDKYLPFVDIDYKNQVNYQHYNQALNYLTEFSQNIFQLPNNIELIIHQTEAFTFIDVNFKGDNNFSQEDAFYKANLSIIDKLISIIKFKNLNGQILVDLLKLRSKENRDKLVTAFKNKLEQSDKTIKVYGLTRLGILEITKNKTSTSLNNKTLAICSNCNGLGYEFNQNLLNFKALLSIEEILNNNPLSKINIKSNEILLTKFKSYNQVFLKNLQDQKNCQINFITDNSIKNDIIIY